MWRTDSFPSHSAPAVYLQTNQRTDSRHVSGNFQPKYSFFPCSCLTLRIAQCLLNKLGSREKILAEVKGCDIFCYYTIVYNVHVTVVASSGVHIVPRPLCCIQDVRNSQPLQRVLVLCSVPTRSQCQYNFNPVILFSLDIVCFYKNFFSLTHPQ